MFKPLTLRTYLLVAALIALALALPHVIDDSYLLHLMILSIIFAIFASAWNWSTFPLSWPKPDSSFSVTWWRRRDWSKP